MSPIRPLQRTYHRFQLFFTPDPSHAASPRLQSPRTGAAAAPVSLPHAQGLSSSGSSRTLAPSQLPSSPGTSRSSMSNLAVAHPSSPRLPASRRRRSHSGDERMSSPQTPNKPSRKSFNDASTELAKAQSRRALKLNDAMVYLDGPQIYSCAQCRTHLTSHDEIISKSFHGRHGMYSSSTVKRICCVLCACLLPLYLF